MSADVPVTANDLRATRAHNSPVLAVDPTDPRFVAAANRLDAPDFGCALHVSADAGQGWVPADPVPALPEGAETCYAPRVGFGPDGVLHYLFTGLAGPGNRPMGVFLTSSRDRARTFSDPRRVLGPGNYQAGLAVDDGGRVHLVWLHTTGEPTLGGLPPPPNPILAAHSDDGGRTFSDPVRVSDPERQRVVAPALATGPDGAVHVLYYDLGDDRRDYRGLEGPPWEGTWELVLATSRDRGADFGPGVVVEPAVRPAERVMLVFTMSPPALAAGPDGAVYAAWDGARHGDRDVFLRRSPDGGRSWQAPPQRLNDDPVGGGASQYLPALSVAPDGRIEAVFYDRRADPEDILNHVVHTVSFDQGATFAANRRLTSEPSDSRSGQRYLAASAQGLVEFGSRIAVAARPGSALAAWTDTRHAPNPPYQDVFAAVVEYASGGDRISGEGGASGPGGGSAALPGAVLALVGAGGLLAVGGATMLVWRRRAGAPSAPAAAGR